MSVRTMKPEDKGKVCSFCRGSGKVSKDKGGPIKTCPKCRGSGCSSGYSTK